MEKKITFKSEKYRNLYLVYTLLLLAFITVVVLKFVFKNAGQWIGVFFALWFTASNLMMFGELTGIRPYRKITEKVIKETCYWTLGVMGCLLIANIIMFVGRCKDGFDTLHFIYMLLQYTNVLCNVLFAYNYKMKLLTVWEAEAKSESAEEKAK